MNRTDLAIGLELRVERGQGLAQSKTVSEGAPALGLRQSSGAFRLALLLLPQPAQRQRFGVAVRLPALSVGHNSKQLPPKRCPARVFKRERDARFPT